MNERDFPHLVELALPPGGFAADLEVEAFHREPRSQPAVAAAGTRTGNSIFAFASPMPPPRMRSTIASVERLTYAPGKPRAHASKRSKRVYAPRIVADHIMVQEDFEFLLETEGFPEVSDDLREVIEQEWPELVHKLPPKD